jgi:hypothetical protein
MHRFAIVAVLFWLVLALTATLALVGFLFIKNLLTLPPIFQIKRKISKTFICQPELYTEQE